MGQRVTVGGVLGTEIPALNGTSKTLTLGGASHIDQLTRLKTFYGHFGARLQLTCLSTEFPNATTCFYTSL